MAVLIGPRLTPDAGEQQQRMFAQTVLDRVLRASLHLRARRGPLAPFAQQPFDDVTNVLVAVAQIIRGLSLPPAEGGLGAPA